MPRAEVLTTTEWVKVAEGLTLLTVLKRGHGALLVNESATDTNASRFGSDLKANRQVQQFSDVETWLRHTGCAPWLVLVDSEEILFIVVEGEEIVVDCENIIAE